MKVLFISKNGLAANLAYLLEKEGHDVHLFIQEKKSKGIFDNMVKKTTNWKKDLKWLGEGGLIIFDDSGFGKIQDDLRKKGYLVFGGSEEADKLEYNRQYSEEIFQEFGINFFPTKTFNSVVEASEYATDHPEMWVIKREKDYNKFVSYVGNYEDGRDVIGLLKNYSQIKTINKQPVSLQKRIVGIEVGVGRYFNGNEWIGPIEMNVEHPHLFSGDIGPYTSEMGTLAWYTDTENKLYKETLGKLEPYLRRINFKGDFAINCIVNETGIYALELTPRLGTPIIHLQTEIHQSSWFDIFYNVAAGNKFDMNWSEGYGTVILLTTPPFPYNQQFKTSMSYGLQVFINELTEEEKRHIHFEEVSKRIINEEDNYYIADHEGYIMYVTGISSTIKEAREKILNIAKKIHIPKMFYRNDIGLDFEQNDFEKLKNWGII
jgi:phosphoribosylamine--glycine ligase